MTLTPKQKYFKKVYDNADIINCACGCGNTLKNKDKYGRNKKYINGHNRRKYDNLTQYKREWNYRNRKQRQEYKSTFLHNKRRELVKNAGSKCSKCGLEHNEINTPLFEFHHIDPKLKKFNINIGSLNKVSFCKIDEEIEKCILVCANCHRLIHNTY